MPKLKLIRLAIGLAFLLALIAIPQGVHPVAGQTIPTRTPTPPPETPPPGGGDPTATQGPPPDTPSPATIEPSPESTATIVSTPVPTLLGGFMATAAPCGLEPTARATSGQVNVRSGPGGDYPLVNIMGFLEVRLINGRSAFSTWWRVASNDGTMGWVWNPLVTVHGYTGNVPLVTAPPLPSGETPTPAIDWQPTPDPACTPPPTETPTTTPEPPAASSATVAAIASATAAAESTTAAANSQSTATVVPATETEPPASPTAQATASGPLVPTATLLPTPQTTDDSPTATVVPLETSDGASTGDPTVILPLLGGGLILAGVVIFLIRRR